MIDLDLAEMGAAGPAVITSVRPCPPIEAPGAGRQVITGLFRHSAGNVLDVYLTGRPEPIGTTANHPFWSEDRREFVRADALRPGERLRTATGSICRVSRLASHATPEIVYNLEVDGEHVYYVGSDGVLVHNHYVYYELIDGVPQYIGRTNNIVRRTGEWRRAGRDIAPILEDLTRKEARAAEHLLIQHFGRAGIDDGGVLANVLRGIDPRKLGKYTDELEDMAQRLRDIGMIQ